MSHRMLCFVTIAAVLAGCGSSAIEPARRTTPEEETFQSLAFGWQAEIDRRAQSKITEPLWLWLDGDDPEGLDVIAAAGVEPTVRVTVKLAEPLSEDDVSRFVRMGLEARAGDEAPTGTVTRDQLLELASEEGVERLDPVPVEADTDSATAQARSSRGSLRRL